MAKTQGGSRAELRREEEGSPFQHPPRKGAGIPEGAGFGVSRYITGMTHPVWLWARGKRPRRPGE